MRHRAKVAVPLCAAVVVSTTWWFVRAPAIEHHVVVPPPDIDIDPPALRARREAALALALTPDDPWTFAESLAASAPAPDRDADRARCGIDERPLFTDPEAGDGTNTMEPATAPGSHSLAVRARMDAALRASADPLDRAVADWLDVGQMRSPSGRVDALVQQAVVSGNAKVYALAFRTCLVDNAAPASCGGLSARRWADLDPGNGVPWLHAFDAARLANDAAGQQEALQHLATAVRYDDYRFAAAAAVASHEPADERDLAAVSDLAVEAIGRGFGDITPVNPLFAVCANQAGGDAGRAQQCQAIADAMFDHTDSKYLHGMAAGLQFRMTGDDGRRDILLAEQAMAAKSWSPATGFSECQQLRDTLKGILRNGQVGEIEAARERMRIFVTP